MLKLPSYLISTFWFTLTLAPYLITTLVIYIEPTILFIQH